MTELDLFLAANGLWLEILVGVILMIALIRYLFACYRGIRTWFTRRAWDV